jgi:hypothetical protein
MADTSEETLLEEFSAIAGETSAGSSAGLIDQMTESTGTIPYTPQTLTTGGQVAGNASANASGGGGGGGTSGLGIAATVLESGLGIVPLIGGLIGLFGGGGGSTQQPLTRYAMPDPVSFQGAETSSGIQAADTDSTGMPRVAGGSGGSGGSGSSTGSGGGSAMGGGSSAATGGGGGSQITVQVQAMDARSFMDRSSDIAAAVRDAMLNLNSINDVVSNL